MSSPNYIDLTQELNRLKDCSLVKKLLVKTVLSIEEKELIDALINNYNKNNSQQIQRTSLTTKQINNILFLSKKGMSSIFKGDKKPLIKQCPDLKNWISDKKEMKRLAHIETVYTIGKNNRKGKRLENASEFVDRVLKGANINKEEYPYLHEIREVNPILAKALDLLAFNKKDICIQKVTDTHS